MDDITEIDAVSYAAAVGNAAAAELYQLLTDGLVIGDWSAAHPQGQVDMFRRSELYLEFLLAAKTDSAEALFIHAGMRGWVQAEARRWTDLPFSRRAMFIVFVATALRVHGLVVAAQASAATPAALPALKREDSIDEDIEALDTKIVMPAPAPPAAAPSREIRARGRQAGKTLSIGETTIRPPVNRGGRGNRKPERDRT